MIKLGDFESVLPSAAYRGNSRLRCERLSCKRRRQCGRGWTHWWVLLAAPSTWRVLSRWQRTVCSDSPGSPVLLVGLALREP